MDKVTSEYLGAMKSVNDFYAMLYYAMETTIPDAKLSTDGSYGWRGFRIDSYQNLAVNQYYCEIYTATPDMLLFQESFKYKGKYFYPFKNSINLLDSGFTSLERGQQVKFLIDFIVSASGAAIKWQVSNERLEKVPEVLLNGKPIFRHLLKRNSPINKIEGVFHKAFPMQDHLFTLLSSAISQASNNLYDKKVELKQNSSWCNWGFRGYRMKYINFNGETPKGSSDYTWRIYFDQPDKLFCQRVKGKGSPIIPPFHLSEGFLTTSEDVQKECLYDFSMQSLQIESVL